MYASEYIRYVIPFGRAHMCALYQSCLISSYLAVIIGEVVYVRTHLYDGSGPVQHKRSHH